MKETTTILPFRQSEKTEDPLTALHRKSEGRHT